MSQYISAYACRISHPLESKTWMDEDDQIENLDEIMNEVLKWSHENNKYFIRHTITYNLLLMGKTRVGKSTIARVLQNPCYVPPDAKIYSETKEITIHTVATTIFNHENIISCFNIIDTPGMFDKVKKSNKSLSNQQIKRAIDKCISEDVTNIHLFAFVINLQTNLDKQDIQSMIFVKDNYPFLHEYICLIVTHSEETNYQQREEKIEEFFQSDKIIQNNLKEFFGKRIFFMGSLRSQLTTYPNKQSVRQQIKNVHQMRDTFIEYIHTLDTNHSFNIHRVHNYNICNLL